jgi:predicted GNAT family acetyltransferase
MSMEIRTYTDAGTFLRNTQAELESSEAANSLMLGVCERLVRHPERFTEAPCLKTVRDENDLVLAAMMTPPHNLVVYGHQGDLDVGAKSLVKDLLRGRRHVPGVLGPSEIATRVAKSWAENAGSECRLRGRQRVYELREVKAAVPERGRLVQATVNDVELVAEWRYAFHREIFGEADRQESARNARARIADGDVYLWVEGQPVSMAMKTRPTRNGISVSLVYTPPRLRRQGYATACVGELSRTLLASGWAFCALFADVSNVAANRVYQRIGYRPVCDYDEYVFAGEE